MSLRSVCRLTRTLSAYFLGVLVLRRRIVRNAAPCCSLVRVAWLAIARVWHVQLHSSGLLHSHALALVWRIIYSPISFTGQLSILLQSPSTFCHPRSRDPYPFITFIPQLCRLCCYRRCAGSRTLYSSACAPAQAPGLAPVLHTYACGS